MLPKDGGTPRYTPKIGLFSGYETADKRVRRLAATARADSRRQIRTIQNITLPAVVARQQRRVRDTMLQTKQASDMVLQFKRASTLGAGISSSTSLFKNLDTTRRRTEEREKQQQELDIATARRRFDRIDREQQPLKLDEAENVLAGRGGDVLAKRKEALQLLRGVEQQLQPRYLSVEAEARAEGKSPLITALDRIDLMPEQRIEVLKEISRRGDENITVSDVVRFAGNVKTGRDPAFAKGVYAQPEFKYNELPPEDTDYTGSLLHLPLTTSRGRLLAEWQQKLAKTTGYSRATGDRLAADQFKPHMDDLRDTLREAGVGEEYLDPWIDMELRRAELTEQGMREWDRQHPDTVRRPKDEEEIDRQVKGALEEEFAGLIDMATYHNLSPIDRALTHVPTEEIPGTRISARGLAGNVTGLMRITNALLTPTLFSGERPLDKLLYGPQTRKALDVESGDFWGRFKVGLGEVLAGLEQSGVIKPLLPKEAYTAMEKIPLAGPPLRREAEFFTSPIGLASLLIPGWGSMIARAAMGGVAMGTVANAGIETGVLPKKLNIMGTKVDIETAAQLLGNFFAPGAGIVSKTAFYRGPLQRFRYATSPSGKFIWQPELIKKQEATEQALRTWVKNTNAMLEADIATGMIDPAVVAGTMPASMSQNLWLLQEKPAKLQSIFRWTTRINREGTGVIDKVPRNIRRSSIFQGMMANMTGGETGGAPLAFGNLRRVASSPAESAAQAAMAKRLVQSVREPEALTRSELLNLAKNVDDPNKLLDDLIAELDAEFGPGVVRMTSGGKLMVKSGLEDELSDYIFNTIRTRTLRPVKLLPTPGEVEFGVPSSAVPTRGGPVWQSERLFEKLQRGETVPRSELLKAARQEGFGNIRSRMSNDELITALTKRRTQLQEEISQATSTEEFVQGYEQTDDVYLEALLTQTSTEGQIASRPVLKLALGDAYEKWGGELTRRARSIKGVSPEDAEDVVNDLFKTILERPNVDTAILNDSKRLKSMLYVRLRNSIVEMFRQRGSLERKTAALGEEFSFRSIAGTEQTAIWNEQIENALKRIKGLTPEERKIFLLNYNGMENKEIAKRLGVAPSSSFRRLETIRNKIRGTGRKLMVPEQVRQVEPSATAFTNVPEEVGLKFGLAAPEEEKAIQSAVDSGSELLPASRDIPAGASVLLDDGRILHVEPGYEERELLAGASYHVGLGGGVEANTAAWFEDAGRPAAVSKMKNQFNVELYKPPTSAQRESIVRTAREYKPDEIFFDAAESYRSPIAVSPMFDNFDDVRRFLDNITRNPPWEDVEVLARKGIKPSKGKILPISGGARFGKNEVQLTARAEDVIVRMQRGEQVSRAEVLAAAKSEGIGARRIRMSSGAIVEELNAKRTMMQRLLETRTAVAAKPPLTRKLRTEVEQTVSRGSKNSLKSLRDLAERTNITVAPIERMVPLRVNELGELGKLEAKARRAALTGAEETRLAELNERAIHSAGSATDEKARLLNELSRRLTGGVKEAAQANAYTMRAPGVTAPLSDVPPRSIHRTLTDMVEGRVSTGEQARLRTILESELQRLDKTPTEVLSTGEWRELGRGTPPPVDPAAQALRNSEDPTVRGIAAADEVLSGGEGAGKPPSGSVHRPLSEEPPGKGPRNMFRSIPTLDGAIRDFEISLQNMAASTSQILGKAPPIGSVISWFNPTPLMEGRLGAIMGGYLRKQQMWSNLATSLETTLKNDERSLFKFVDNVGVGMASRSGHMVTPEYLFEHPEDIIVAPRGLKTSDVWNLEPWRGVNGEFIGLSEKQTKFLDDAKSLLDQVKQLEAETGVEFEQLGEEMGRYFPRKVIEAKTLAEKEQLIREFGTQNFNAQRGFMKDRSYTTMWDGMMNGVKYGDGLSENIGARIRAGLAASLDKEVAKTAEAEGMMGMLQRNLEKADQSMRFPTYSAWETINNFSRPLVTNVDLGFIGLQLIPALCRNPAAGLRGILYTFDGLVLDGRMYAGYIKHNLEDGWLQRYMAANGVWNQSEFSYKYAAANTTATGGAPRWLASLVHRGPFNRFDKAFTNSLNAASLETFKGMVGVNDALYRALGNRRATALITKAFGGPGGLGMISGSSIDQQAASVASKLTLRMNKVATMLPRMQSQAERLLFFAPGYYRAMFGLLGDAIQGGMRGAEARRSLGQLIAGYMGMNYALETLVPGYDGLDLNPKSKNFLRVRVGDLWIGPGGPFVSLAKLIGKTLQSDREGDYLVDLPFGLGLNPALAKFNIDENPIMRWGRGKLSPVASLILDTAMLETFVYDKIDTPKDWLMNASRRITPFFIQAGLEYYTQKKNAKDAVLPMAIEWGTGATTYPISQSEHRDDVRNEVLHELYRDMDEKGLSYSDPGVNDAQRKKVDADSRVIEANEAVKEGQRGNESNMRRALDAEEKLTTEWRERGTLNGKPDQFSTQAQDDLLFNQNDLNGQGWVTRYRDRQDAFYDTRGGIRAALQEVGLIESYDEEKGPTNPIDKAIDAYYAVMPSNYLDEKLEPRWDEYFAAKDRAYTEAIRIGGQDVADLLRPEEENPTVKRFKTATKLRTQLDEMPKYRFVDKAGSDTVDQLLDQIAILNREIKTQGGKSTQRGLLENILNQLPREDPRWNIVAVAYLRTSSKTRSLIWNPERDELIMRSPDSVKFYVSLYRNMSDDNKLRFLEQYGTKYFDNDFIEEEGLNAGLPGLSLFGGEYSGLLSESSEEF